MKNNKGFTLIELLAVIIILSTMALVSVISITKSLYDRDVKECEEQRELAQGHSVIMEGRDITTVVFPDADIKIYLTASLDERARRRYEEMKINNSDITFEEVKSSIMARDENDMKKEMGALKVAEDAIVVDNTNVSIEDTFKIIEKIISEKKEHKLNEWGKTYF